MSLTDAAVKPMRRREPKWVSVFLEVALRALRRVHFEYGVWGAGRQWRSGPDRPSVINMGHGLELADERAVCAAIVQEFMSSPSLTGLWQEEARSELRFFGVLREQPYKASADPKRPEMVDLIIEKYEHKDGIFDVFKPRSFIEAKRARLWQVDLAHGKARPGRRPQLDAVVHDIEKLRREREARLRDGERIYLQILVWGIYDEAGNGSPSKHSDHPDDFFNTLSQKSEAVLEGPYARWLPIRWETSTNVGTRNPVVTRSAWIALAEVDKP